MKAFAVPITRHKLVASHRKMEELCSVFNKAMSIGGAPAPDYVHIVSEVKSAAESIHLHRADGDGRIDSANKEAFFLNEMQRIILTQHPDWNVCITPPRADCDFIVNSVRINLKLTDCKTADNSVNKRAIYFSITGDTNYPTSSNWNEFLHELQKAKAENRIKTNRDRATEYHYLVKNKITGEVLFKPIFDIHRYVSNASNDLQINWKKEFQNADYVTADAEYVKKVGELLVCIQTSVRQMIERTKAFAEADIESLFK